VCVPGCPIHPDNLSETILYLLYQATGQTPMIPLDEHLRPTWLFGPTVHEGCDRAGYYEQGDFATEYGSPKCIVKLGCWGPVAYAVDEAVQLILGLVRDQGDARAYG
jgi:hydrogenase small subunit